MKKHYNTLICSLTVTAIVGCAHQTNPQNNVDVSAKDDIIQLGPNLYQVLRKAEFSGFAELKRSATVAAVSKCLPQGKEVKVETENTGFSMGFFNPVKELLMQFRCI